MYRKTPEGLEVHADLPLLDDLYYLVIPVVINSKKYNFIIDTCSGNTLFDIKFKPLLGDYLMTKSVPFGFDGNIQQVEIYKGPKEFIIGDVRVKGEFACMDMSLIKTPLEPDYDGIVGMHFLDGYILQFDIENHKMRLLKKVETENKGDGDYLSNWGHAFPLIRDHRNWPFIHINLGGIKEELFMIDTGLYAMIFNFLQLNSFNELRSVPGAIYGLDDSGKYEFICIPEAQIGKIQFSNLRFASKPQSVLGMAFMKLFKMVTFDFENNILYLKP